MSQYFPPGIALLKASMAICSPLTPSTSIFPHRRIANAVSVHTKPESILGPSIATRPSRTGWSFRDAPCMIEAVPTPASFTNAARRAPISATPINAPQPAFRLNASRNMLANTSGTSPI